MENFKKYLPIILRVIVSLLFLVSAVAKLYPSPYFAISTFEVKQLYPLGFTESTAVYFSRILIGIELALGLLLLQRHYLKKLVIPATVLMLLVFIIHLTIDTIQNGGNSGNCGCFGSLLPMTSIEAIIKNIVAVILLIILYRILQPAYDKKNSWVLAAVTLAAILFVFMLAPIQPIAAQVNKIENTESVPEQTTVIPDSSDVNATNAPEKPADTEQQSIVISEPVTASKPLTAGEPATVKSVYSSYFANADKGKKIIAMFAPGCEHCRAVAKELTAMKAKDKDFPQVNIIFMDEEANLIPDFFKEAGAEYPYKILDIISFWKLLGNTKDTPGVIYLWNGNKIAEWDGINDSKFVPAEFLKAYKKPYSVKK